MDVALARPIDRLPASAGSDRVEPKLDGWRGVLAGGPVPRLYSRHGTDLSRAFSDVVQAAAELPPCVLDGEVIAVLDTGALSFARLQTRSGKGPRPGADFTVQFAAFDVLADDTDLRPLPYLERRRHLLDLLESAPATIWPVPMTDDLDQAKAWFGSLGGGVEGCVLKPARSRYIAGYSSGWRKFRVTTTVEAVVVGIVPGSSPARQAAVLAQPDARGRLRPVGISLPLDQAQRSELASLLHPTGSDLTELPGTLGGLPGSAPVAFLPVEPEVVVEIETDERAEFARYRHRPKVKRVRADLRPEHLART
ncbi:ATP-dependent DNA ligase [Kitasatospora sp. NPDC092039]|uniref:ATP-dependent DNA ligase n=1 Tax=Kitasatospora sp. NPDC092039 TaxID=3364086 RepID=UPI00382EE530